MSEVIIVETNLAPTIIEVISKGPKGDSGDAGGAVTSVNGVNPVSGAVTLVKNDLGLGNVENKSSATIRGEITSGNVATALGFTPLANTYVPSWASLTGKPTFSSVALSGAYSDLTGLPTPYSLPTGSTTILGGFKIDGTTVVAVDGVLSAVGGGGGGSIVVKDEGSTLTAAVTSIDFVGSGVTATTSGAAVTITIPTSTLATLGIPNVENKSSVTIRGEITSLNVTNALGFTPLANSYVPTWASITGKPTFVAVATSGDYNDLSNKPSAYSLPTSSTTVLGGVKVDGTSIAVTAGVISTSSAAIGLGNVNNTSDANKSISTAAQAALDNKAPTNNPTFTGTVTLPSQTAKTFFSAPNGAAGVPNFRLIVDSDIPTLNQNTTGTAGNVTGTVLLANGGTGATTQQTAINAIAGAVTSGSYLRGNGTNVTMSTMQVGDVPTLNQNTTGTSSNVTGVVLGANGGTGVANSGKTITLGGNHTNSGAYASTFTFAGTTTVTFPTSGTLGYLNIPQNSQSAAYTLVLADAGQHILHPSADTTARIFTIPANSSVAFAIGTAVTFINQNAGGVITIAITTDTMRLAGAGTTGSRTLAANGIATAVKLTSTEWLISGVGLT